MKIGYLITKAIFLMDFHDKQKTKVEELSLSWQAKGPRMVPSPVACMYSCTRLRQLHFLAYHESESSFDSHCTTEVLLPERVFLPINLSSP